MTDLTSPLSFRCGATAKNRMALAPLTNQQSHDDGTLSPEEHRWLTRRAEGGFGFVTTCAAYVAKDGKGFEGQLGVAEEAHLPPLRALATDITHSGALGLVQLYHGGVRAPSRLTGARPWSASEFEEQKPGFEVPREGTIAEIEATIDAFVRAATLSRSAGFQGVEIHGAHGYLLGQFLSVTMNTRSDAWGGSLEHRARLIRTVTKKIREATPAPFVVGVRLSPEDFGFAKGHDLDESIQVARWLADDGVDYVHLSLWDVTRMTKKRPTEHAIPLFRAALPDDVRIFAAGKIWTREEAETVLSRGADVVAIGRAAIIDPDWAAKVTTPDFAPERGPLSPEALAERSVSPKFVAYLKQFPGIVETPPAG